MPPSEAERPVGRDSPAGERELIERIRRRLPAPPSSLVIGPGDDGAVVTPTRGALQVITTDALVEGIHFDRRFSALTDVGYKALAVNLSDIVAMGATPEFALLSLILPPSFSVQDLDALLDGVLEIAAISRTTIAGGNISRSPGPLIVDVTATGSVRPRRILTRSGGRPGDVLYVTGSIGAAAAGLSWLQTQAGAPGTAAACIHRHRRPEPRLRIGMLLGRNKAASACMDLSDGLAAAVRQLAEASGTGAIVDAAALPIEPGARDWFTSQGLDPVIAALTGGDDYELAFTMAPRFRGRLRAVLAGARGVPITRIGELTTEPGVRLLKDGETTPIPPGFAHF